MKKTDWRAQACKSRTTEESSVYRDAILRDQLRFPVILSDYRVIAADYGRDDTLPLPDHALGVNLRTCQRYEPGPRGPTDEEIQAASLAVYESAREHRLMASAPELTPRQKWMRAVTKLRNVR